MGVVERNEVRDAPPMYARTSIAVRARAQSLRGRRMIPVHRFVAAVVAALALSTAADARLYKDAFATLPPIGPGPYPVACSNVEQNFSRIAPGSDATAYWEGRGGGGTGYITDLLVDPANSFVVNVTLPTEAFEISVASAAVIEEWHSDSLLMRRTAAGVRVTLPPSSEKL